jgi:hypothetical protein
MRVKSTLERILGPAKDTGSGDGGGERPAVTIRYARPDEGPALQLLAYLDSSTPPQGVVLVAEVDGQIWAAHSLDDGHTIADPFRASGELAFLLTERGRQLTTGRARVERRAGRMAVAA